VIVDVNVNLSRWPFRRLTGDEPADLVSRLRKGGVVQAWAGTFDGIFHKDISSANARLAEDCRVHGAGFLVPFGSINLKLPDWKEDLRRCNELHKMPGIRLHPNYHGYKLSEPAFRELLDIAASRKLIVQIALCMEDERTQPPLMRVPPVDLDPLAEAVQAAPQVRMNILNCFPTFRLETLRKLGSAHEICFDFAMIERIGAVSRLAGQVSFPRVVFGSNYPLYYLESALLKVRESGLTEPQAKMIYAENARRLMAK
jgi:predicted TIM-barrel fold metal-dependent hydrolase